MAVSRSLLFLLAFAVGVLVCVLAISWYSQGRKASIFKCVPEASPTSPSTKSLIVTTSSSQYEEDCDTICAAGSYRRFPDAIIIGVRKGGTRALIDMLKTHPRVLAARGEVHYFDNEENFSKGVGWYIERMPYVSPGQIAVEKSPSYFINEATPERIFLYSRHLKLILIVRDPVQRAISDFTQLNSKKVKKQMKSKDFEEVVLTSNGSVKYTSPLISVSMYDVHLQKWFKYFKREQIHFVNGDKLITSPHTELRKVETFLKIDSFFQEDMFYYNNTKGFYCWKLVDKQGNEVRNCLGSSKGREHPFVSEKVISRLKQFFEPHNRNFYSLTGEQFDW